MYRDHASGIAETSIPHQQSASLQEDNEKQVGGG